MFPLVKRDEPNPVELFQIWLNLPAENKLAPPHFSMLWAKDIPRAVVADEAGRKTEVTVVAGKFGDHRPPAPPPHSWASRPESDVAIWCLRLDPSAVFTLPRATGEQTVRVLYFFSGESLRVGARTFREHCAIALDGRATVTLENGATATEILLLQGRPIGEPVVQHGPFVMNTREEIQRAITDYQRTRFGGWPWPVDDPVHGREAGRFARHADGKVEDVSG
jgi:redox-sensitive bicupin YhaK (pirin superfamily)